MFQDLARQQDKAILLVTHDLRLEKYADKVYEMIDGKMTDVTKKA